MATPHHLLKKRGVLKKHPKISFWEHPNFPCLSHTPWLLPIKKRKFIHSELEDDGDNYYKSSAIETHGNCVDSMCMDNIEVLDQCQQQICMALGPYICKVCTIDFLTQDDARARICDIHHCLHYWEFQKN